MKLSLEKINKNILLITILLLLVRVGNFYNSFIPKPFEILFTFIIVLTAIYTIWQKKITEFFLSIPKNILISSITLFASVLIGWGSDILIKHTPTTLNIILEFGTFSIGFITFLLVLFYTRNDQKYKRYYLYALLIPVIYCVFIIFPKFTPSFLLAIDGNFTGLTPNVNIISKTLLIPAMFFISYAVLFSKNKKLQLLYIVIAAALVALLVWISSRGALLSLGLGIAFLWAVVLFHDFTWKKLFSITAILLVIVFLGFTITPYSRKQVALNRVLNSDAHQFTLTEIKGKSLTSIVKESAHKNTIDGLGTSPDIQPEETRLQIWPYYIKNVILINPLGIGPNTHIESKILNIDGDYVSTGPHNTYLQIWMWGGILGIISYMYIVISAFDNLRNKLKKDFTTGTVALLVILLTVAISIAFDDSLSLFCFWILLALAIRE